MNRIRSKTIAVGAALALALVACGGDDDAATDTTNGQQQGADAARGDGGDQPVVRVMTIAPVNVGTWDPQHYATYHALAESEGWDLEVAEAVPYGEAEQVLSGWGEEGVDVVFAADSGFGEAVLNVAPEYPDTVFAVMSALASTNDLPNVTAYSPNYCEMGYMAGAIGGLASESGKVGVVSGLPVPAVEQFFNGAEQGFDNETEGDDIELSYSGDWVDPVRKAETAAGLVANGADVIFSFDTVPTATDQRVQELGKRVIGIFADESPFAPDAVITSVVLNWQGYQETVDAAMDGTFEPGIHVLGFADGMIDVLPVDDSGLQGQIQAIQDRLEGGSVEITGDCG